jgi:HprK-related kinase A
MKLRELDDATFDQRLRLGDLLLRLGPFTFAVQAPTKLLLPSLRCFYDDFPVLEPDDFADFQLCLTKSDGVLGKFRPGMTVFVDGRSQFKRFAPSLSPVMLEWAMNRCIFTSAHRYLMLHAATVEREGLAVMIVGDSGAGKSTLCAGLVAHGWRLLSDEFALIDLESMALTAIPRPIALKNESIEVIANMGQLKLGPKFVGTSKGTIAHALPPIESVACATQVATPKLLVFPGYQAGERLRLQRISPAKTLIRVVQSAFNYVALQSAAFNALCSLVERCPGVFATYSSLPEVVDEIEHCVFNGVAHLDGNLS